MLVSVASACHRGPSREAGFSATVGVDASAPVASSTWRVVRVERQPVAVLRDAADHVADMFEDSTLLITRASPATIRRQDTSSSVRWTTTLDGDLTVTDTVIEGDEIWILGYSERSLGVSGAIRWTRPPDDAVTSALVLLRLDSESGRVVAASIASDRNYFFKSLARSGDGVLVAGGTDVQTVRLARYDRQFVRQGEVSNPGRYVDGLRATSDGGACLDVLVPEGAYSPRGPDREHWCIDAAMQIVARTKIPVSRARTPDEALAFWTDGPSLVGHVEQHSRLDYELHLVLPSQPDIVIESVCRELETVTPIEAMRRIDKDGHKPPGPSSKCQGTAVTLQGRFGVDDWKAVALAVRADITVAGQLVAVAGESLVLVKVERDTITYSVHAGPRFLFARHGRLGVAQYSDRAEVYDLGSRP